MMPRLTVAHLMLGVAGLAVILAAGRAHFSLGSLVFGFLAVGLVRVQRRAAAERRAGRVATRRDLITEFGASFWTTGLMMAIVAAPAVPLLILNHGQQSCQGPISEIFFCPVVGWWLLRRIRWKGHDGGAPRLLSDSPQRPKHHSFDQAELASVGH